MRIRIKFRKQGDLRFIGHLDVMRYFQKLNRRAKLDIRYSGGFSPHQMISFSAPLGLGITSDAEYGDFEMNSVPGRETLLERMNSVNIPEMEILDAVLLPEKTENAMSALRASDYTFSFREGYGPEDPGRFLDRYEDFLGQREIIVLKETKKSSALTDIRPQIRFSERRGNTIFARLDAGSKSNLNPELLLKSFSEYAGCPWTPYLFSINRDEQYGEEDGEPKCLLRFGTDFGEIREL